MRNAEIGKATGSLSRIFMQHFKLCQHRNIQVLENKEGLLSHIKALDKVTFKTSLKIPLIFIKNSHSITYETNMQSDAVFEDFLKSLGVIIQSQNIRTGFYDHIKKDSENVGIVYSTDFLTELVFLIPSLKLQYSATDFQKEIDKSKIVVIWNSREEEQYDKRLPNILETVIGLGDSHKIVIILVPLKNGLIKVLTFNLSGKKPKASIL
jgi:hypothetical protein